MSNEFTTVRNAKGDAVLLKDSSGAIIGVFNNEAEAEQAKPIIAYNLERGRVPARLLKSVPPHRRRPSNKQVTNKNRPQQNRRKPNQ